MKGTVNEVKCEKCKRELGASTNGVIRLRDRFENFGPPDRVPEYECSIEAEVRRIEVGKQMVCLVLGFEEIGGRSLTKDGLEKVMAELGWVPKRGGAGKP